ncbi:GntR family transcriptional regulator [Rhizobiaceae bacterium BDR2-2]|uniref:GntR family transcriptional regulator n=1 Tax=Ectorhizobium quercum TaxID=2965071 RepID=A0AAE3SX92_9HYPH|nr:GntR family transcriptional regulator [Ectorhizobium quercum]MCX9000012.1 GntR family transcriptional regulator [Ectorhizobium quercum]
MREPIQRKSLQDQATEWLREAIVRGDFAPGEVLTELMLTDRIGLGRSTVRSALFAMEAQELVTRTPYSSWHVAVLDARVIWEIYTLRAAFEGLGARILAERRAEFGTGLIETAFAALAAANDAGTDARVAADLGFHASFIEQTGHQHLIRRHGLLADKVEWLYRWSEAHWPCRQPLVSDHQRLFDMLMTGTPDAAEQAVRDHIAESIELDVAGFHELEARGAATLQQEQA